MGNTENFLSGSSAKKCNHEKQLGICIEYISPGALSTLVTSVVFCSLTRATLMSPGKDETRVCEYSL